MIFILIGLGIIGFLPMLVILYRRRKWQQMVKYGVASEATVKELHGSSFRSMNRILIEYTLKDKSEIISRYLIVAGMPYSVGDKLPVYYDPKNPKRMQIDMKKAFWPIFMFTLLIAAFVIFACFKLYAMFPSNATVK